MPTVSTYEALINIEWKVLHCRPKWLDVTTEYYLFQYHFRLKVVVQNLIDSVGQIHHDLNGDNFYFWMQLEISPLPFFHFLIVSSIIDYWLKHYALCTFWNEILKKIPNHSRLPSKPNMRRKEVWFSGQHYCLLCIQSEFKSSCWPG